eukprot:355244-Chlamydomonas_euryale.AAC.1
MSKGKDGSKQSLGLRVSFHVEGKNRSKNGLGLWVSFHVEEEEQVEERPGAAERNRMEKQPSEMFFRVFTALLGVLSSNPLSVGLESAAGSDLIRLLPQLLVEGEGWGKVFIMPRRGTHMSACSRWSA